MDSRKVASELIELSGGTSNIKNVTHCSTRLRFIIKDKSAVEVEAIKKCEGVLGVVFTTDELQMVFGKNVIPVYTEASKIYEAAGNKAGGVVPDEAPAKKSGKAEKKSAKTIANNVVGFVSASVTPLIPGLVSGGMLKVFLCWQRWHTRHSRMLLPIRCSASWQTFRSTSCRCLLPTVLPRSWAAPRCMQ